MAKKSNTKDINKPIRNRARRGAVTVSKPTPAVYKSDKIFNNTLLAITVFVLLILFGIFVSLFFSSAPSFKEYGLRFFTTTQWNVRMNVVRDVSVITSTNGTGEISADGIRINFLRSINPESVNNKNVVVKDFGEDIIKGDFAFDYFPVTNISSDKKVTKTNIVYNTNQILFVPETPFASGQKYKVDIKTGIRDENNFHLSANYQWGFSLSDDYDRLITEDSLIFADTGREVTGGEHETKRWYGALPFVSGTLLTSLLALLISMPFSIAIAIFLGEYFTYGAFSNMLKTTNELLAGIPSIIYGFWAFFFLVPMWGANIFTSSLILSVMIIPYSASLAREVISLVPPDIKEAAYAMGATRFEVVRRVIIPYAGSGIFAGVLLAFGRALGETMAVTMVIGNRNQMPDGIFSSGQTIASLIANEYAEAGGLQLSALTELGLVLFLITMIFGLLGRFIIKKLSVKEN
jgi:phosphate transport system permease protein